MRAISSLLVTLAFFLLFASVAQGREYKVGEGDVLKITVFNHDDMTKVVRVGGDGNVDFPLVGMVKVSGLTVAEVGSAIATMLSNGYIINPQVSVFVEEFRSQRSVIMGEVQKPGLYELKGTIAFLELISMAGGLSKDAGEIAIIKRRSQTGAGGEKILTINLVELIAKGNTSLDVDIIDGDSIYINKAGVFYVTGEVKKPDSYKYTEGTTVIQAITMAGGFTDRASAGKIKIIRKEGNEEYVLDRVKLDEPVVPSDVIVVPESFF